MIIRLFFKTATSLEWKEQIPHIKHWYQLTAKRIYFVSPQAGLFQCALFCCKGCKKLWLCTSKYCNWDWDWNSVQFGLCLPLSGYLFNRVLPKKLHSDLFLSCHRWASTSPFWRSRKSAGMCNRVMLSYSGQYGKKKEKKKKKKLQMIILYLCSEQDHFFSGSVFNVVPFITCFIKARHKSIQI